MIVIYWSAQRMFIELTVFLFDCCAVYFSIMQQQYRLASGVCLVYHAFSWHIKQLDCQTFSIIFLILLIYFGVNNRLLTWPLYFYANIYQAVN